MIAFQRTELNKMQQLSLLLADRASAMLDQNEWLLDSKLGDGASAGDANTDRDAARRDARRRGRGRGRIQLQGQAVSQKV